VEERNALRRQTGLWSTEAKMWRIVPKSAWHWGGDISVTNDPLGAPGITPSYVCLPPTWGSAPGYCGTNTDHKKSGDKWRRLLLNSNFVARVNIFFF
jgi:hypothetical protein